MKKINNLQFTIYKKGFTLIELLIAIAIISILASFLLANFVGVRQRARDGVRKSDLRQIQSALELYRADKGSYPNTILSCGSSLTDGESVIYMQKIPCDPLGTTINYQYSSGTGYCLRTCLENINDGEKDAIKYGSDNPSITGCTLSSCSTDKRSYTIQNP